MQWRLATKRKEQAMFKRRSERGALSRREIARGRRWAHRSSGNEKRTKTKQECEEEETQKTNRR
jgi:hypothetical protein